MGRVTVTAREELENTVLTGNTEKNGSWKEAVESEK